MIYVRFVGQLGNQMFQYVAVRLTAERLNCRFVISHSEYTWRDFLRRRQTLQLFRTFPKLDRGVGSKYVSLLENRFEGPCERIRSKVFPKDFRPFTPSRAPWEGLEGFDPAFHAISKFTRIIGYFQSPLYMKGHEEAVRTWFARSREEAVDVEERWSALGLDPDCTVAVHVRLSDYRVQTPLGDNAAGGWLLPPAYYHEALDSIGPNVKIALFSDEPETAVNHIGRRPDYISKNQSARSDFLMMSSCKYMITANSTFSWWAAWLNSSAEPVIIAPKFFLGRNLREWYPRDIAVENWQYV